ncbi:DNA mismatch repair protein MutL [Anaerosphaera aminiphila DSM 21120]|uniref:DNA mismatch repair protein MutL n=1 Tax=Anaerosphaera aminiphila DSM 21120 TaxID=1120995 RepID=A0A1M5NWD6_9FIRM|nr:DNA mismatch repair endonuclease MutL [Anaerosphaera aminiphila]SHG93822.1 DNA mismatch repair protein MutL [Anaerosphaera aminiphila DSM 21120]
MSIIVLDEATVSKIAAGEIIENPASIVKELIENSIDANSKNIIVEIKGSIGDFIRITDDGDGMDESDLNLAFLRHATSKLRTVEDLNNIVSLGFRGEALASISHISKLEVLTKTEDSLTGLRAEISNGKIDKLNNVGLPKGTTFFVRDVFFNTPVRKKYLKNDNVEFNYIYEVVQKISLGNPDISIKLIRDNKVIMNTNSEANIKNRIFSILGRDIASNLLNNTFNSESYKINIYFSNNKLYRSNRMHQYIYINGRYVKNLEISKIIEKYYYSLIPLNRYPVFLLYLDIDPILVDVNIHPKKHEVKLSKDNNVLAIIGETVEEVLYPNRRIPDPIESYKENKTEEKSVFEIFNDNLINSNKSEIVQDNFIKNNVNAIEDTEDFQSKNVKISEYEVLKDESEDYNANAESENIFEGNKFSKIDNSILDAKIVGILFKTFIILENTALEKIYLVDQHAAHERIMYEKYKRQYESSSVLKQILLKPEVISLSPEEMSKVQNNLTQFQNLGFEIEEFGDNTLILREIPMVFGEGSYTNFIYDAISSLDRNIKSSYEVDPYKIMKKACKSAVKAGDRLSNIEVDYLLKDLINCDNPYTCPHGRPTIIEVKKYDIEKLFLRE